MSDQQRATALIHAVAGAQSGIEALEAVIAEFAAVRLDERDEKYLAVIDRMIDLEQALRRLLAVHTEPCRLDHEGFCQEHYFESPCGVAVARTLLEGPE